MIVVAQWPARPGAISNGSSGASLGGRDDTAASPMPLFQGAMPRSEVQAEKPCHTDERTARLRAFDPRGGLVKHPGAAVVAIDWRTIHKRLFTFAVRRHRLSPDDADEVVQQAILRFLDPAYVAYDPAVHGDVLRFLGSIVNSLVANQRRRPSTLPLLVVVFEHLDTAPSPEDQAIVTEHAREVVALLLERTARDRIASRLLALLLEGVTDPEEQAANLGVAVAEIKNAMRRLKTYLETITKGTGGN